MVYHFTQSDGWPVCTGLVGVGGGLPTSEVIEVGDPLVVDAPYPGARIQYW